MVAATLNLSALLGQDVQLLPEAAGETGQEDGDTSLLGMGTGSADTPAGSAVMTATNEDPLERGHSTGTGGGSKLSEEKVSGLAIGGGAGGVRRRSGNTVGNVTTPTPRSRGRRGRSPGRPVDGGLPPGPAHTGARVADLKQGRETVLPPISSDTLNRPHTTTTGVPEDRREKTGRAKMSPLNTIGRHANIDSDSQPRSSPRTMPQGTAARGAFKPATSVFSTPTYYSTVSPSLRPHLAYLGFIARDTTPGFHGPDHQRPLHHTASGRDATIWIVMLSVACFLGGILLATVICYGIYKRQWRHWWRHPVEPPSPDIDPQPDPSPSESPPSASRDDLEQLAGPKTTLLQCDVLSGLASYNTNEQEHYRMRSDRHLEDSACLLASSSHEGSCASTPDTTCTMISMDDLSFGGDCDMESEGQLPLHRAGTYSLSFRRQDNESVT